MIQIIAIGVLFFCLLFIQRQLYTRLWEKGLYVTLSFSREHVWEGEQGELKEIIENRKRLPLSMLKVKFKTDRHLLFADQKGSRTTDQFYRNDVFRINGGEKVTRTLTFEGGRRGYYTIDSLTLVASDLFFTTQMVDDFPVHTSIYVYPKPFESAEFKRSLTQLNGEVLARRHLLEDPFEYRGIREYQPYDDIKDINWKATAKTGDLKVNQKNYTSLKSVQVFYNVEDDNIMKKEDCVEASLRIVAGLCSFFLAQGIQVSCFGNALDGLTGEHMEITAKSGNGQLDTILRGLARLDLEKPVADFTELFEEMLIKGQNGLLTCFVAPNQYEDFLQLLQRYQDTGRDYVWFYPLNGKQEPELPSGISARVRFIHLDT